MIQADYQKKCNVVISSCDAYQDCWEAFFTMFFRYWPDCPFSVYLISNHSVYPDSRVKPILLGEDAGWADNMRQALKQIDAPYFIYFLEDVFLRKKVDTKRILDLLVLAEKEQAACLRLYPAPGPNAHYKDFKEVGEIKKGAPYRISLMTAIWNKKIFIDLLAPGENAWQMELKGSARSNEIDAPFLSVPSANKAMEQYATAIKKGMWFYDAIALCEREGIKINLRRPVEPFNRYVLRRVKRLPFLGKPVSFILRRFKL